MSPDGRVASLPVPAPETVDVKLVPRPELGPGGAAESLSGRLSVAVPILTPVSPDVVDNGVLETYAREQRQHSEFYLLHLVVNLRPVPREPFTELGVGVVTSYMPARPIAPIAWALSPSRSAHPISVSTTIGLTAKLGLVEAPMGRTKSGSRDELFAVGYGDRESGFEWRFTATSTQTLEGAQRMFAVLLATRGVSFRAEVKVSATVRRPVFGLLRMSAALPQLVGSVEHVE